MQSVIKPRIEEMKKKRSEGHITQRQKELIRAKAEAFQSVLDWHKEHYIITAMGIQILESEIAQAKKEGLV